MKLFKYVAAIAVAAMLAPSAFAQTEGESIPTIDYKNEVSFNYGNGTIYEFAYLFSGVFASAFSLGSYGYDNFKSFGCYSIGYQHKLGKVISLGAAAMYNGGSFDMLDTTDKTVVGKSKYHVFAILPTAKAYWFQKRKIAMYSKLGCGVALTHDFDYDDNGNKLDKEVSFAMQVSPVGFEFGGRFRGFVEYGMGSQGNIMLGVKYGF